MQSQIFKEQFKQYKVENIFAIYRNKRSYKKCAVLTHDKQFLNRQLRHMIISCCRYVFIVFFVYLLYVWCDASEMVFDYFQDDFYTQINIHLYIYM